MTRVADSVLELIGNTPVVKLNKLGEPDSAAVYAKLESFNPLSSVKDRIALGMIEAAEREGAIEPGKTLVEPTSGNTGIGLACVCACKGYRLVLTMPETMSVERRKILQALGAEIVLTEGAKGMRGAMEKARELAEKNGWTQLQQFENKANPETHRKTTAKEILEQVPDLDAFVAGVGTGGTLTGVGNVLRERITDRSLLIVAVEPEASPVLSGGKPGPHRIQGIGAGFVPPILQPVYDRVMAVGDEKAFATAGKLARVEGLFVGPSSGAAAWAAFRVARELGRGKKVVVLFPDTGERYLSLW